jgi:P27 family predicted phage terminase small subunit
MVCPKGKGGRKFKSAVIKKLEGCRGHHGPLPEQMKIDPRIPDMPDFLDDYAKAEWDFVAPGLCALGILAEIDKGLLTAYCQSWSIAKRATEEMGCDITKLSGKDLEIRANPLVGIANKAWADVVKYGDLLGMGESARARLGMQRQGQTKSKFEGLIGMVGGKKG